jgi:carboxymethylenebutenolidase
VQVRCDGGADMDAYVVRPERTAAGALVVIQEIFGVNEAMRAIADDFAGQGFMCIVPDIFFRLERRVELGNGEDPVKRSRAIELMKRFDQSQGVRDLADAAVFLRRSSPSLRVGVVGYCLGGRLAAMVGASGAVDATCGFYGVGLDQYLDTIKQISIPVQFHFGEADDQIPAATVEAVRGALARSRSPAAEVFTYPGAQHAFYNRHRVDRFDPAAYASARTRVLTFFAQTLGPTRAPMQAPT